MGLSTLTSPDSDRRSTVPIYRKPYRRGSTLLLAGAMAVSLLSVACSSTPASEAPSSSLSQTSSTAPTLPRTDAQLPRLTKLQTRGVMVVMAFLDAYNAGDLPRATDLLADDAQAGDCDYRKRGYTGARGKSQVSAWLGERMADHDNILGLQNLSFGEPNADGQFAVGVSYTRRTSDALRSIGFASGIEPRFAIKVVLTGTGEQVLAWVVGQCPDGLPGAL